jgi:hypothetical protein
MPITISVMFFVILGKVSASLLAPATRAFAEFRRQLLANKALQATCQTHAPDKRSFSLCGYENLGGGIRHELSAA